MTLTIKQSAIDAQNEILKQHRYDPLLAITVSDLQRMLVGHPTNTRIMIAHSKEPATPLVAINYDPTSGYLVICGPDCLEVL